MHFRLLTICTQIHHTRTLFLYISGLRYMFLHICRKMDNKETSEFKNLKHQLLAAVLFNFVSKIKDTFYALPKTFIIFLIHCTVNFNKFQSSTCSVSHLKKILLFQSCRIYIQLLQTMLTMFRNCGRRKQKSPLRHQLSFIFLQTSCLRRKQKEYIYR